MTGRYREEFEVGARHGTYGRTITGGRIVPSAMTMAISTAMTEGLFRDTVIAQLGLDRGRFLAPVRPGDTITTEVEVLGRKETSDPARGVVVFRDRVRNQRGETVFEVDKTVLIRRRGP